MSSCCGPSRSSEPSPEAVADGDGVGPRPQELGPRPLMVEIPGGVFTMGTDDPRGYRDDGEGPTHEVELEPFLLGAYAVTNDEFAGFVEATRALRTESSALVQSDPP